MEKELSRNEISFRRYLKRYHPDKYEELIWRENTSSQDVQVSSQAKLKNIKPIQTIPSKSQSQSKI